VYVEAFSPNGADQSFNHSNGCECPESFAESKQVSLKCYAWQNTVAVYTCKAAVEKAVEAFGSLDVVVNNAGYGDIASFEQLAPERFKAVIDTNFYGVVYVTRAALPIMRKQKSGCILQVSSVGGRVTRPGSTPYHAAKWAVGGFTESLAKEVAPFGVKLCALEPGGMRTDFIGSFIEMRVIEGGSGVTKPITAIF